MSAVIPRGVPIMRLTTSVRALLPTRRLRLSRGVTGIPVHSFRDTRGFSIGIIRNNAANLKRDVDPPAATSSVEPFDVAGVESSLPSPHPLRSSAQSSTIGQGYCHRLGFIRNNAGSLRRDPQPVQEELDRASRVEETQQPGVTLAGVVPLIVVLDMDECLIHSTSFSTSSAQFRQHEEGRPDQAERRAGRGVEKFAVDIPAAKVSFTVIKRPGVDMFLQRCCDAFETYVFTAGTEAYANRILDVLDPDRRLAGRLYRQDCKQVDTLHGEVFLKDLSVVARRSGREEDGVDRIILVDNNPLSFVYNPRNGILVSDFVGEYDDVLLRKVWPLLQRLGKKSGDVRRVLHPMFGLEGMLADARKNLLGTGRGG